MKMRGAKSCAKTSLPMLRPASRHIATISCETRGREVTMSELPPSYNKVPRLSPASFLNQNQLPLYGMVRNPEKKDDEYLLAVIKISNHLLRPTWEEPTVHTLPGEGVPLPTRHIWLGIQPSSEQTEALVASK